MKRIALSHLGVKDETIARILRAAHDIFPRGKHLCEVNACTTLGLYNFNECGFLIYSRNATVSVN